MNVHLATRQMDNVDRKHVGIYLHGRIWHYSNAQHKVITQTPAQFSHHFSGPGFAHCYGRIPSL